MRVQTLAQPPRQSRAPPDAAGLGRSGQVKAVKGTEQTAPPPANDRSGGAWLDARLPTGTVAFWTQLIGQKMLEGVSTPAPLSEIASYLDAYSRSSVHTQPADDAVLNANLLDKPMTFDLYI